MKALLKNVFNTILIKLIILAIIILLLLSACMYFITIDDGSYNDGDKKNAPYAVSQYTNNITFDSDGKIKSGMTAQELWDEMKKNNNRALEYIDKPEQLLKLMNAELVTQFLDTRSNPDEPIDWNSDKLNDVNSNEIQGIVKLKRSDITGNNYTMTYVEPATFQAYIDNYNASGSEADRNKVLKHFTIEAINYSSGGQAATISAGETVNVPSGLGNVHTYMGWQKITSPTSSQYKLRELAGMNFDEEGFGRINGRYVIACTTTYGTVGDYIDFYQEDGTVIPCIIGDIKNQNDDGCNEWGHNNGRCIIEFVVDMNTWYNSGHANPGTSQCHPEWSQNIIKAVNGGSYYDNPDFTGEGITANGSVANTNDTTNIENNNEITTITKYYAKIATWTEQTTTITSNDPDVQESTQSSYSMTSTSINYQDLVKGYTMPFEYLWAFLVIGENIDFSLELANLVYNSKIEITVYDNLETDTDTVIDTYTKKKKIDTSAKVTIKYGNQSVNENSIPVEDTWKDEESNNYKVTQVTVTKTNTLNIALTQADVWFETYSQEYAHEQPTIINSNTNTEKIEDKDYPDEPDSVIKDDTYKHAQNLIKEKKEQYENSYTYVSGVVNNVESKIYNATTNRTIESTNEMQTINYVSSPPDVEEKTDPNSDTENFSTIFKKSKYINTKQRIFDVLTWLFEILENNESTSDMVDLTKYLLHKATGRNYGVEEFNFSEYTTSFNSVTDTNMGTSTTGSNIIEIAKGKLGSEYQIGAKGPNKFDCSGFVYWVYKQVGINVPGSTDAYKSYAGSAKEISWSEAKPGDILIIFNYERNTTYGHAGIYLGNDEYIHSPQTGDVVKISQNAKSKFKHVFRFYTEATGGTAVEGDGYDTEITFNNRKYKEYKQSKGSYTTAGFGVGKCSTHGASHVHNNGCGPTSVAIVASGYGKNYSPGDIATLMGGAGTQSSGSTISNVLNKIGISSHAVYGLKKNDLKEQLLAGRPFVVSVDNSMNNLFTSHGHLMAILSIDSNDNVYVSNPNPGTKNGWVPLDTLYQCCKSQNKYAIFIDQN